MLAAVVVYMPYQQHYPLILPLKGLNIINVIFLGLLASILDRGLIDKRPLESLLGLFATLAAAILVRAFTGAYGAFCVTFFWDHFSAEKEKTRAWRRILEQTTGTLLRQSAGD